MIITLDYILHGTLSLESFSGNDTFCPGIHHFTCIGRHISNLLYWRINGTVFATYIFNKSTDIFPLSIEPSFSLHDSFEFLILSASATVIPIDFVVVDFVAVFKGDLTDLRGSTIQCAGNLSSELYYIEAQGKQLFQ